jgi:predicted RNA binding protein YcfA (HicA-like mRNA interferase family)
VPRLKRLKGPEVIAVLQRFGFAVVSSRGSHVTLKRIWQGEDQTLTIPNHPELDSGTLKAIFRQACRYIPPDELKKSFYSE